MESSYDTEDVSSRVAAIEKEEVRSEVQDYLYSSQQRRRLLPRALLVGLAAGAVAVAFRGILAGADSLRDRLVEWSHHVPVLGFVFPMLFGIVGAVASVLLVRRFAPEAGGSGIPHLEAVLRRHREMRGPRVLAIKFFGGALAIGGGLILGREGPTVQMGAATADVLCGPLRVSARDRLTLLAAGSGAGLAAAFNAPLAGLVFVLEEIQRDFRPIVFGAAFIAAAGADVVTRFFTGQLPTFHVPSYPVPPLVSLPAFLALGILTGFFGVAYNRALLAGSAGFARIPARFSLPAVGLVGAAVGLVAWWNPLAVGGGHHLAEVVMAGGMPLAVIPLWFLVRFGLTIASYSTGAPGGIFAPLLALGALIGLAVGQIAHLIAPGAVPNPAICAVVGMAAYFTAIVRAPLTGIVLILEMTGNYEQILPLIIACFAAYAVAEALNDRPIYEALLERDLARGGLDAHTGDGPIVVEMTIQPGSPFDGKRVRNLGLPPGCILVRVASEGRESIPNANTELCADDRITAVVAPEAADALALLREGCDAA